MQVLVVPRERLNGLLVQSRRTGSGIKQKRGAFGQHQKTGGVTAVDRQIPIGTERNQLHDFSR